MSASQGTVGLNGLSLWQNGSKRRTVIFRLWERTLLKQSSAHRYKGISLSCARNTTFLKFFFFFVVRTSIQGLCKKHKPEWSKVLSRTLSTWSKSSQVIIVRKIYTINNSSPFLCVLFFHLRPGGSVVIFFSTVWLVILNWAYVWMWVWMMVRLCIWACDGLVTRSGCSLAIASWLLGLAPAKW